MTLTPLRISTPARISEALLGMRNEPPMRGDSRSFSGDDDEIFGEEVGVEYIEGGVLGKGEGGGETCAGKYKGRSSAPSAATVHDVRETSSREGLLLGMGESHEFRRVRSGGRISSLGSWRDK